MVVKASDYILRSNIILRQLQNRFAIPYFVTEADLSQKVKIPKPYVREGVSQERAMHGWFIPLYLICYTIVFSSTAFGAKAPRSIDALELKLPSSTIPDGEQFKTPCHLAGVYEMENIKSFKLPSGNVLPISSIRTTPALMYTQIQQGDIITANCADDTYVFESERTNEPIRKSFTLKCMPGGILKKDIPDDFCDKRCDITDLREVGYITPKTILNPGEEINIKCPPDKTTRAGDFFPIKCAPKGLLHAVSPLCFNKVTSCPGPPRADFTFPQGTRLNCKDASGALTYVLCENAQWDDPEFYSNHKDSCEETIGQVDFTFFETLNLNDIDTLDTPIEIPIQEFLDFCVEFPLDKECKQKDFKCNFGDASYDLGHTLVMRCPGYDNNVAKFICLNDTWQFGGFDLDADMPLGLVGKLTSCGPNSVIIESILPENTGPAIKARFFPTKDSPSSLKELRTRKTLEEKIKRRSSKELRERGK